MGLAAQPAFAQDVQDEPPASPPTEAAVPQSVEPLPEPVPVPSSLDEMIPPEAVDDPENWATRGVVGGADAAVAEAPADPGQAAADNALSAQLDVFLPPPAPGLQPALDAAFANFAVEVPAPLTPDPELEALASIATPVTSELPELADVRINNTLALG
ncbi:MAG: hypothetical protein ACK554_05120 [Erythrobacteraceae bacterium]